MTHPVTRAIEILEAREGEEARTEGRRPRSGLQLLAAACGVSYQAVRKWERKRCPAEQCQAVAQATGHQVTPHELRPDVFASAAPAPAGSTAAAGA